MTDTVRAVVEAEPFTIGDALHYQNDSKDRNPIHYGLGWFLKHPEYSRAVGISTPIVPGMLYAEGAIRHGKNLLERTSCFPWNVFSFEARFKKPLYYGVSSRYELSVAEMDELNEHAAVFSTLYTDGELFTMDMQFVMVSDAPGEPRDSFSLLLPVPAKVVEELGDGVLLSCVKASFPPAVDRGDLEGLPLTVHCTQKKQTRSSRKGAFYELEFFVFADTSQVAACMVQAFQVAF